EDALVYRQRLLVFARVLEDARHVAQAPRHPRVVDPEPPLQDREAVRHFAPEAAVPGAENPTHPAAADLAGTHVLVDRDDAEVEELFIPGAGERFLDLMRLELAGKSHARRTRFEMLEESPLRARLERPGHARRHERFSRPASPARVP